MGDVLVDQRHGVVPGRAVPWEDTPRLAIAELFQRVEVLAHVAVGREDRRRAEPEDRVAGEEIAVGREVADVLARVARRGDDLDPFDDIAVGDSLVDIVQYAGRRGDTRAGGLLQRNRRRG